MYIYHVTCQKKCSDRKLSVLVPATDREDAIAKAREFGLSLEVTEVRSYEALWVETGLCTFEMHPAFKPDLLDE
jgi:hypothetical protein